MNFLIKFSNLFSATEMWEKLQFTGTRPQPRAESIALSISDLILRDNNSETNSNVSTVTTTTTTLSSVNQANRGGQNHHRSQRAGSVDRSKSLVNNKIGPVERKYIFNECNNDYASGNLVSTTTTTTATPNNNLNFLKEISKLSSINLSRLNHKCSYSVLNSSHDSTESLLKTKDSSDTENTPTRMVKSQSANVIANSQKRKLGLSATTPAGDKMPYSIIESAEFSITDSDKSTKPLMPRDPVSVPNLNDFVSTLPTPVLTPIECTRLVYLDSEEENELDLNNSKENKNLNNNINNNNVKNNNKINLPGTPLSPDFKTLHQEFDPKGKNNDNYAFTKRYQSDSYTSHLVTLGNEENNPEWKAGIPKSASAVRFRKHLEEITDELTSDYCSIETMNRVSSSSNYSQSPGELQSELINDYPEAKFGRSTNSSIKKYGNRETGGYGFSNPNYLGPDVQTILKPKEIQNYAKLLNSPPDSVLEDASGRSMSRNFQEQVEMKTMTNKTKQVEFKISKQVRSPPRYLPLKGNPYNSTTAPLSVEKRKKSRASSASRAERPGNFTSYIHERLDEEFSNVNLGPPVPFYVYVIGGKEHGQITVFKRPISIWKLQLSSNVY